MKDTKAFIILTDNVAFSCLRHSEAILTCGLLFSVTNVAQIVEITAAAEGFTLSEVFA